MTATTSLLTRAPGAQRRRTFNRFVTGLLLLAALLAVLPLLLIIGVTIVRGLPAMNLAFLTETFNFSRRAAGGGYLHGLVGSLYMGGLAALMAIPLGIATAVYLTEFPRSRLAARSGLERRKQSSAPA